MLDGRRGLVPSNFVEKLEGEELFDFHQQVVLGLGKDYSTTFGFYIEQD